MGEVDGDQELLLFPHVLPVGVSRQSADPRRVTTASALSSRPDSRCFLDKDISTTPTMATETISLREELKAWERRFTLDHDGRKPSREEIKSNAEIAAKYKQFNLMRKPEPERRPVETPKKISRRRDISENALRERAPNAAATTPRKNEAKPNETAHAHILSPVKEEPSTPAFIRSALGPTPQRDGHVLGIFDMLPNPTPSKRSPSPSAEHGDAVNATPSKGSSRAVDSALSRTPQSSGKRYFLDSFITTPGKRKRDDDDDDQGTPSTSKKLFATPSFLRRVSHPMASIDEEADDSSAMPPPRRMKPLARSFSAIIQDLKNQEEERMDDEWDVLNELEAEENGYEPAKKKKPEQVLVEDSQGIEMPLGPDQAPEESESEEEVVLGANGLPRKPYKKRGLKRQTRRVNMKPALHKPKKAAELEARDESGDEAVGETQLDDANSTMSNASKAERPESESQKSANPVKKVAQKVSQNFRRLKIKNKNSKANGRGRFGRR